SRVLGDLFKRQRLTHANTGHVKNVAQNLSVAENADVTGILSIFAAAVSIALTKKERGTAIIQKKGNDKRRKLF
ncbi:MAG: hypothetical protein K2H89_07175, partial [Oscillospiraceae bacterium]|nr:hypothetical protein [Oscillospiraceae bacterium]